MATPIKRNSKRRSKDFIYEVEECDLSPDDEPGEKPSKIIKIDSDDENTSKIKNDSNLQAITKTGGNCSPIDKSSTNEVITIDDNSDEMKTSSYDNPDNNEVIKNETAESVKIMVDEKSNTSANELQTDSQELPVVMNKLSDNESELNNSVQIIEDSIPIMVLSEDEMEVTREEGEIIDGLEVVDEVGSSQIEEDDDFIMKVSFKTEKDKNHYEDRIVKFLHTFPEFEVSSDDLFIHVCKKVNTQVAEKFHDHKTPKKKHKKKKTKKELFVVDTKPSENDTNAGLRYSSKFTIGDEKEGELGEPVTNAPSAQRCFNCGEAHALKDCPVAKNYTKINNARQKFMSNRQKNTRYHVDEDQKYAHLKPGVISENLRKALGVKNNEYPAYIYGMRTLGYPPGWLEEAKFVHSQLRMFDIDGEQVENVKKVKKRGLDPDKIVEYHGFNAPMEKGFRDEYRRYNVDQYSKYVGKEYMLKHFENIVQDSDSDESRDFSKDMSIKVQRSDPKISTSLTQLETMRKEVINELNSSNSNDKNSNEKQDKEDANRTFPGDILAISNSKSTALGTPILKSSSPYATLPRLDNFMAGVSPVIDFENLPNSTGTYEQMTEVLSKVRKTMKNRESLS